MSDSALALFDFDGTITSRDSFLPFILFASRPSRVLLGKVVLLPYILGYKLNLVSPSRMRALLAKFALRGIAIQEAEEAGRRFASAVLPNTIRPEAVVALREHRSRGHRIVVVSAALDIYLRPWCEANEVELVSTVMERQSGKLTGKYLGGDCTGEEKISRLKALLDIKDYRVITAYGDTVEDVPMLRLATSKVFRWLPVTDEELNGLTNNRVFEG